ncbi:MAG: universal stress protein [Actinomycetota bacterium]|nr:universal stress protein [Actinomycetota bacterium]
MINVVLALSTFEPGPEAIASAIGFSRVKEAKLFAVFVLDSTVSAAIFDKLTDIGFIGEKPGAELEAAVSAEYRRQAATTLAEVKQAADAQGVECEIEMVEGDFVDKSLEVVARHAADTLIIVRTRKSFLSRLLTGSGMENLVRQAPCEIKVFEA